MQEGVNTDSNLPVGGHLAPRLLIVEPAPGTREGLRRAAASRGFDVLEVGEAGAALELARNSRPQVILVALETPGMPGLDLLARLRAYDVNTSVVALASRHDPDQAEEALALGAVNYLHKPIDPQDLRFVLDRLYRSLREEFDTRDVLALVRERTVQLSIPSSPEVLSKAVAYLGRELIRTYGETAVVQTEIRLALYEALANALEHGNLEISFDEKSAAMLEPNGIDTLIRTRMADERLRGRRIHITAIYTPSEICYTVRDDGLGFDPEAQLQKPLADTSALHGRGITLIRHYMDEVEWEAGGRAICMRKTVHPTVPDPNEASPT